MRLVLRTDKQLSPAWPVSYQLCQNSEVMTLDNFLSVGQ